MISSIHINNEFMHFVYGVAFFHAAFTFSCHFLLFVSPFLHFHATSIHFHASSFHIHATSFHFHAISRLPRISCQFSNFIPVFKFHISFQISCHFVLWSALSALFPSYLTVTECKHISIFLITVSLRTSMELLGASVFVLTMQS